MGTIVPGVDRSQLMLIQKHANDPGWTLTRARVVVLLDTDQRGVSLGIYVISILCVWYIGCVQTRIRVWKYALGTT